MNSGPNISSGGRIRKAIDRLAPYLGAIVFSTGLLIRLILIHSFPVIYGVDGTARLVNSDKILLAHQLPLLQTVIYTLAKFSENPLTVRYFMAFAGAAGGLGAYKLGVDLLGRIVGFAVGLLFATQPFVLLYSIVPYQEILMLAGLLFAFHHFHDKRWMAAGFWLALACFSRYEAWIACPLLAVSYVRERGLGVRKILYAALVFGWAPIAWMAYQGGLSPAGTSALVLTFTVEKFHRYLYLGYIGLTYTPAPALLLALAGLWDFLVLKRWREKRFLLPGVFVALFLVAVLFVGHGVRDQPDRYTTSREAHIPIVAGVFLAGLGLLRLTKFRFAAVGVSAVAGLAMAVWFVQRDTSDPRLKLSFETARYLDDHVAPSERVALLAKPLQRDVLERYLRDARARGGEGELRQAVGILTSIDASPLDAQRVKVHSKLGKNRLLSFASFVWPEEFRRFAPATIPNPEMAATDEIEWIVAWSDFAASNGAERVLSWRIADATPVEILEGGGAAVRIYHLR